MNVNARQLIRAQHGGDLVDPEDPMWISLFKRFLRRLIHDGDLEVEVAGQDRMTFGNGTGQKITVRIADIATVRRLLVDPELALGESYMDGKLSVVDDDIQGLLGLIVRNRTRGQGPAGLMRLQGMLRRQLNSFAQANPEAASRRNVAHHYDLTPAIYDLFLDPDRQYSCAYFTDPSVGLEAAQAAKKAHIARKLLLEPGMHVLDIGCGWGGLALTLAGDHGVRVTGITLSQEQLAIARGRADAAGLADRVSFKLLDYRALTGSYDRIVSVGMFEHVGTPNYQTFFDMVRDRLTEDGVALIHTIGQTAPPKSTNRWIAKYIFPGGHIPALSEVAEALQKSRLRIGDLECLRLHYAMTLRHWFDRFSAKAEVATQLKDERFVRMWRFYLAASEQTFRHDAQDVFQFQLCKRPDAVPITRDYLYAKAARRLSQAAE